jgi:hypothetical protein
MTLEVPRALGSTTRPAEGEISHALLDHYRVTRTQLDAQRDGSYASISAAAPTEQPVDLDRAPDLTAQAGGEPPGVARGEGSGCGRFCGHGLVRGYRLGCPILRQADAG